jgi:hypothetical protein
VRAHEVVALNVLASAVNVPGEYVVACVNGDGHLVQRSGKDAETAAVLEALMADLNVRAEAQ